MLLGWEIKGAYIALFYFYIYNIQYLISLKSNSKQSMRISLDFKTVQQGFFFLQYRLNFLGIISIYFSIWFLFWFGRRLISLFSQLSLSEPYWLPNFPHKAWVDLRGGLFTCQVNCSELRSNCNYLCSNWSLWALYYGTY